MRVAQSWKARSHETGRGGSSDAGLASLADMRASIACWFLFHEAERMRESLSPGAPFQETIFC
jgi:hypothetical protein